MRISKEKKLRPKIQLSIFIALFAIIILYRLYIKGIIGFKILSIADLNPYGGWSALKDAVTDSGFEFDGLSKSIALTISIFIVSILGGRFLCGWICPLGTLQDFSYYIRNYIANSKLSTKHNEHLASAHPFSRKVRFIPFSLFILIVLLFLSIFGQGAKIAGLSPWRAFLNLPGLFSAWKDMKLAFIILILIVLVSMHIPRFFCRYLCPLGAAQTLFASISLINIKTKKECTSCNYCLKDCPMDIKLAKDDASVSPDCIRCMNCIDNCHISDDTSLALKAINKKIKISSYSIVMLALFFTLWLALPKVWTGNSFVGNIPTTNLKDGVYQGEAKGFAARIVSEVLIKNGEIINIRVLDHHESKGWYDEVFMVLPKEIVNKQTLQVDAISGATKTSKGLIRSIEDALKKSIQ